jgi:hypothetical protein
VRAWLWGSLREQRRPKVTQIWRDAPAVLLTAACCVLGLLKQHGISVHSHLALPWPNSVPHKVPRPGDQGRGCVCLGTWHCRAVCGCRCGRVCRSWQVESPASSGRVAEAGSS